MSVSRLLFLFSLGFLAAHLIRAETTIAGQVAGKNKPATPVEPRITFNWVHVDGPYIAMTFDDGPNATLTPKLLDILAAHHIKATFFVIGETSFNTPRSLRARRAKVTK
jgi:peptidoglycan/xylan/chitin deacetylase (PgdA/CDA1 family)